jgi:hypothetical protein
MTPIRGLIDTLIVIAASISTTATGFLFEAVAPLPRFGALATAANAFPEPDILPEMASSTQEYA